MIKIICLGKIKESFYNQALEEYQKRLKKYHEIEIIELKDYPDTNIEEALKKEAEEIKKALKPKDNPILLDINGIPKTSLEFAKLIEKDLTTNSNITFIIGSSNGVSKEIKSLIDKKISFSSLTFPHQLFRVILLEQIYRSFKIINNEQYHK